MENFSRPRNMVCPRHGVSVGSCSHDVDLTPEGEVDAAATPVKEDGAAGGMDAAVVLDRVEEFAEVPLDEEEPARCKCSDDEVSDDSKEGRSATTEEKVGAKKATEEARQKSGLLTKEVFLTPSLPGAPEDSLPTPPPTHPLTPETFIAGRTRPVYVANGGRGDASSLSPSPPSTRAVTTASVADGAAEASSALVRESDAIEAPKGRRPPSALSNLSACNETTQLNSVGM